MDRDPKLIVLLFNEAINTQNIEAISMMMSDDHRFIDSSDDVQAGKELMVESWQSFFNAYPDYKNHFQMVISRDNLVLVIGYSSCSFEPLNGPAIWSGLVENDLVAEWRVYLDTAENRQILQLPPR